ncbi:MAG: serine/threonine protein kinase [Polyangiaceae bacterium]|nr:serine/threonine protein kinase [Polyangiaceae bacterium]
MDDPRIPKPRVEGAARAAPTLPAAQRPVAAVAVRELPRRRLPSLVDDEVVADKYRLLRPLGEGGMGTLWLARHEALDIDCALKVIRADIADVEREYASGRLLQEARAAARLGHPAIVRVTDVGRTSRGDAFLVMELLNGEDLGSILDRRGRFAAENAVQVLLPIVHALACAHDKGIVHRDVKPENIFVARSDDGAVQPKLVDFGIAKLRDGADRLTAAGAVLGTPGYMAPEQARGGEASAAADVWAVCVILHELVMGERPFPGDTYGEILHAIADDEPAPLSGVGPGEAELAAIVRRGLAKAPEARWPTIRDLGVALAEWLLLRGVDADVCGASLEGLWLRPRESLAPLDTFDAIAAAPRRSVQRGLHSPSPAGSEPPPDPSSSESGTHARVVVPVRRPTPASDAAPTPPTAAPAPPEPSPPPASASPSEPRPVSLPEPSSAPRPAARADTLALATWERPRRRLWPYAAAAAVAVGVLLLVVVLALAL